MFGFAAPDVRASLGISREQWGFVSGATRAGVMASFVFLLTADRLGRRTLLMVTVIGFTVFNTMTAFVTTTSQFVSSQMLARLFLTAEYSLAIIVVGEEYPARLRGRSIAILTSLAAVGVMAMAKIQPYVLLSEGEASNWLHATGIGMVAAIQGFFGLGVDDSSWRALYVLSAFPLVLVLFLRIGMRETRRFDAVNAERQNGEKIESGADGWAVRFRSVGEPWSPRYRARTWIVTLLWNCVHLVTAPSVVYWVIFAGEDLGLTTAQVGEFVFWGYGGGVLGHFVAETKGMTLEEVQEHLAGG